MARSVNRRRFLSSGIMGGGAMLSLTASEPIMPGALAAQAPPCIAPPTAVDSLSLAAMFLADVTGAPMCVLHEEIVGSTDTLATKCKRLLNLIKDLTEEVPDLAENTNLNRIHTLANRGANEFGNINPLTDQSFTLIPASFAATVAVFDRQDMLNLAKELSDQQRTIVLSSKAVGILRSLVTEIKSMCQEVEIAHGKATNASESAQEIYDKVKLIREGLNQAVAALLEQKKDPAFKKLDDVNSLLIEIDKFYDQHFKDLSPERKEKCEKWYGVKPPTEYLRDYLSATRALVNEEIAESKESGGQENAFQIVKASFQPAPAAAGIFDIVAIADVVGQVLHDIMIENTFWRRWGGAGLVRPLLRYTGDERIRKLAEIFPKLVPEGVNDRDKEKGKQAAKKLCDLLKSKGL